MYFPHWGFCLYQLPNSHTGYLILTVFKKSLLLTENVKNQSKYLTPFIEILFTREVLHTCWHFHSDFIVLWYQIHVLSCL